jgi:hypothetical protein
MAEKTFYNPSVGVWVAIEAPNAEVMATYPAGTVEIPSQPSVLHTWNGSSWDAPTTDAIRARQAEIARARRDDMLRYQVDPVVTNPLRWAALSEAEQQEVSAYRQALLDVTNQAGFPQNINWATRPSVLPAIKVEWDENIL